MRFLQLLLVPTILLIAPAAGMADVANGDFETGGTDWSTSVPVKWVADFPATGGNPDGYGRVYSPAGNSVGEGCIYQTFVCGIPNPVDTCRISFDYKLTVVDANPLSGRVKVYVDDNPLFTSPPSNFIDWTTASISVPCGTNTIELCLEVDPGNNLVEACFDNVRADCITGSPADNSPWGQIKALFE